MKTKWILRSEYKRDEIKKISNDLKINKLYAQLLLNRNLKNLEQIKKFISPSLDNIYDPFLMKDMEKAVNRINKAISKNEKILIYGDYDVDGTTSISMLYRFLCNIYNKNNIGLYSPDRETEGYGLSYNAAIKSIANNYKLLICLDCGTSDISKIEALRGKIDFIVCDHHISNTNTNSFILLNPQRKDCQYPYKYLSACGVTFKLIQAICIKNKIPISNIKGLLDFVCVSIAADIVPITDENRIFAYHGLKQLNQENRLCFKLLKDMSNCPNDLKIPDIVFGFAPRINSASRINHAKDAIILMTSNDTKKTHKYINKLEELNTSRRSLQDIIFKECLTAIEKEVSPDTKCILIKNKNWKKGLIGIIASKIVEKFYKPTIIFTESNGYWVGSGRSIKSFDLNNALKSCSKHIKKFGGHRQAVGLTLDKDKFDDFKSNFIEFVNKEIDNETLTKKIDIDASIKCRDINNKLIDFLKKLEPYGPDNTNPIFTIEGVRENNSSKYIGENNEHLIIYFYDEIDNDKVIYKGVIFNVGSHLPKLEKIKGEKIDIVFSLKETFWQNYPTIEIIIKDFRLSK